MVDLYRWAMDLTLYVGALGHVPDTTKVEPESNGVWVDPLPETAISPALRKWAAEAQVAPTRIPGYWYYPNKDPNPTSTERAQAQPGEKVVFFMHGGAYLYWSAHPSSVPAAIQHGLVNQTRFNRLFSIEYRLASHDGRRFVNPLPAALLDALAGYRYLTDKLGLKPSDITVCGDSAGGHLTMNVTRYLRDNTPELLPRNIILLSPWTDLSDTFRQESNAQAHTDYVCGGDWFDNAVTRVIGNLPDDSPSTNVYISPGGTDVQSLQPLYNGFPRTFIAVGSLERDWMAQHATMEYMRRDMGTDAVVWHQATNCVHDFLMFDWEDRDEQCKLYQAINEWA